MADQNIKPLRSDNEKCGLLITRKKFGSTSPPKLYFIPNSDLKAFELKFKSKQSNLAEAKKILGKTPAAESHEVVLHGEFVQQLKTERCAGKPFKLDFDDDCCAVNLDRLKQVLGIVE